MPLGCNWEEFEDDGAETFSVEPREGGLPGSEILNEKKLQDR